MKATNFFRFRLISFLSLFFILSLLLGCTHDGGNITLTTTFSTPTISVPASSPHFEAPVEINTLSDGQTVRVNLVKFTGNVTSSNATVLVNDSAVFIDNNNYYVYLDLQEGENVIEVKTTIDLHVKTELVHIFFKPPLTVYLYRPSFEPGVNYLENPLTMIEGYVSDPLAKVEVNGIEQEVDANGRFIAEVTSVERGNIAVAVATLGDETDTDTSSWQISDEGVPSTVTGHIFPFYSYIITKGQTINLQAGEYTSLDFAVSIEKLTPFGSPARITIARLVKPGYLPYLPMPPDLRINIEPSSFSVYPKIDYYSTIKIETDPSLIKVEYYFNINFSDSHTGRSIGLTINIE